MRKVLTYLVAFLIAAQSIPAVESIQSQVARIGSGAKVEVRLIGAGKLRGTLRTINETGFSVETANGGTAQAQSLRFDEVKSIKATDGKKMSRGAKICAGLAIGFGVTFLGLWLCASAGGCISN